MTNASLQFTVVLLLCGTMAAKSIGKPVETDSSDYSSDSSSSYDEGEYIVDSHSVPSIVQKLRGPLMRAAARAKMFVAGKPADDQRLKNIIDVPINCPPGWKIGYDGECHPDFDAEFESMRIESKPGGANVIDPPPNCPEGWLPGEDGECHPIFEDGGASRASDGRNVVDPPINCPEGWLPGEDGECHPIFEMKEKSPNASRRTSDGRNVIDPPPNCPEGWLPGEDGECHPPFEVAASTSRRPK